MQFEKGVFKRNVVSESFFPATEAEGVLRKPAYRRKNEADMTAEEQQRFRTVITALIDDGTYGELVAIHIDMSHRQHTMAGPVGSQRFLPWHRAYLLKLEEKMRERDATIFIPYWDWTRNRGIPAWMADFLASVRLPDGIEVPVTREPGTGDPEIRELPAASDIDQVMEAPAFTEFTLALEGARPFGAHNQVHVWVGGIMNTMASPADPIFWLHHAQVDRLWSEWQVAHPNERPLLRGRDTVLDPWEDVASDMNDISTLGYTYAEVSVAAGSPA